MTEKENKLYNEYCLLFRTPARHTTTEKLLMSLCKDAIENSHNEDIQTLVKNNLLTVSTYFELPEEPILGHRNFLLD